MEIASLAIKVDSTGVQRAGKDLEGLNRKGAATERQMRNTSNAIKGFVAALGISATIRTVIANTVAQEEAIAQLEQTLKSTGRYTPELSANMQEFASALQGVTTFGDEAVIASQALLLTFTQIGGPTFGRAQRAILDVATAMKTDLKSATLQVGKALNDPILGVTALARSGIQFTESQKDMIKTLVDTGRAAEAQAIILTELETQMGGSAEAARNTLGGAMSSLKNAFGDLLEGDSGGEGVKGATASINELTETLSDPATKEAFANITSLVLGLFRGISNVIVGFDNFTTAVADYVRGVSSEGISELQALENQITQLTVELNGVQGDLASPDWMLSIRGLDRGELESRAKMLRLTISGIKPLLSEMSDVVGPDGLQLVAPDVPVTLSNTSDQLGRLTDEQKKAQKEAEKLWQTNERAVAALDEQAAMLHMTETEMELYKLQLAGATDEQIRAAATSLQLVNAYKMQAEAANEAARAEEQKRTRAVGQLGALDPIAGEQADHMQELEDLRMLNEMKLIEDARYLEIKAQLEEEHALTMMQLEEERFRQQSAGNELLMASLDQLQASATDTLTGILTGATNSKEAFQQLGQAILKEAVGGLVQMGIERTKNFLMARVQQAAETTAGVAQAGALATAYAPAAAASAVSTFGGSAVAGLASMASAIPAILGLFTSFEGGGFTGSGSRSGGMDGKGGFMAMVHPNETVIDHTKGQSMGGSTVVNVNNAPAGTQVERSQGADGEEIINVIIADMRSGGPASQTMSRTFGIGRVGA